MLSPYVLPSARMYIRLTLRAFSFGNGPMFHCINLTYCSLKLKLSQININQSINQDMPEEASRIHRRRQSKQIPQVGNLLIIFIFEGVFSLVFLQVASLGTSMTPSYFSTNYLRLQ